MMAIVLLILILVVVVIGGGGYQPWAALVTELGAAGCAVAVVLSARRPGRERDRRLEQHLAWKALPWTFRHPLWLRLTGRAARVRNQDIEILAPTASEAIAPERHTVVFGTPLRRTGLGAPLCVLSLWIGLSVVPLERGVLEFLSPAAHGLRSEVEAFTAHGAQPAPMSLVPFLTARALWLWLAYLVFYYVGFSISKRTDGVRRLTNGLVSFGALLAATGLMSSLVGWRHFLGDSTAEIQLRAVAGFGNPNHFAAFLCMIFFCGLGALVASRGEAEQGKTRSRAWGDRIRDQEDLAKTVVLGAALVLIALGILFSLSRSALAFAMLATALFLVLTRRRVNDRAKVIVVVVLLATLTLAASVGVGPVFSRFEHLSDILGSDASRFQVAVDSLPAASDFRVTGSGLGSFRYISAQYRSFPDRIFYSWAHNDYLQLLVELGVPGLVLLLWTIAGIVSLGRRARDRLARHSELARRHAGYVCAAFVIALHSFTDFSLHLPANFMLLAVIVGVVVGMEAGAPRTAIDRAGSLRHPRSPRERVRR